jgi:aminopeptidase-like protein
MSARGVRVIPDEADGQAMYRWATDLFPLCRSLTGPGVRETLEYLSALMAGLAVHSVPSGTRAFDWTVPDEWTIRDAYIADESGRRVIDFRANNLHVVGYSEPVDRWMSREALEPFLHSLPDQPTAVPYVFSYYSRTWGFCLSHEQRLGLPVGQYRVVIDSDLKPGVLNYGELVIPGDEPDEVLLSTYICHPSMANNELSGPVVAAALARWLQRQPRRLTYRVLFLPETLGAIVYLSQHADHLRRALVAGFVVTCAGDDRGYSYVPSRHGNTPADAVARYVLTREAPGFTRYRYLDRGSDERQYCSPGIDLPVCSVMRTKYGEFPEYHTSHDDLSVISPSGLSGAFRILQQCIKLLEVNRWYRVTTLCEPQLSTYGLYPTLSTPLSAAATRTLLNVLAYADGTRDLLELAATIGEDPWQCAELAERLRDHKLVEAITRPAASRGPVRAGS